MSIELADELDGLAAKLAEKAKRLRAEAEAAPAKTREETVAEQCIAMDSKGDVLFLDGPEREHAIIGLKEGQRPHRGEIVFTLRRWLRELIRAERADAERRGAERMRDRAAQLCIDAAKANHPGRIEFVRAPDNHYLANAIMALPSD